MWPSREKGPSLLSTYCGVVIEDERSKSAQSCRGSWNSLTTLIVSSEAREEILSVHYPSCLCGPLCLHIMDWALFSLLSELLFPRLAWHGDRACVFVTLSSSCRHIQSTALVDLILKAPVARLLVTHQGSVCP